MSLLGYKKEAAATYNKEEMAAVLKVLEVTEPLPEKGRKLVVSFPGALMEVNPAGDYYFTEVYAKI